MLHLPNSECFEVCQICARINLVPSASPFAITGRQMLLFFKNCSVDEVGVRICSHVYIILAHLEVLITNEGEKIRK